MKDEIEHSIIRNWVALGHEQGLLGKLESLGHPGMFIEVYFIGSPTLVGSRHPDNSRMAISPHYYRRADANPEAREIIANFDAICAERFPKLIKRRQVTEATPTVEELLSTPASAPEQPAERPKLVRRGSPS